MRSSNKIPTGTRNPALRDLQERRRPVHRIQIVGRPQGNSSPPVEVQSTQSTAPDIAWQVGGNEILQDIVFRLERIEQTMVRRETSREDWLLTVDDELLEIKNHPEEYGEVRGIAWEATRRLLRLIAPVVSRPDLGTGDAGEITLDWWGVGTDSLTAEVHPDGHVVFAARYGQTRQTGSQAFDPDATTSPAGFELALANIERRARVHTEG